MTSLSAATMPWQDTMDEVNRLEAVVADPKKPFESMYKARDVLKILKNSLAVDQDTKPENKIRTGVLNFRIGRNHLDTEETGDAEKHLALALTVLLPPLWVDQLEKARVLLNNDDTKDSKEADIILTPLDFDITHAPTGDYLPETIDCLNHSGILWTRRGEVKRALLLLEMSHRLYKMVVVQLEKNETTEKNSPDVYKILNSLNMHTLFYLAQVHGALGNSVASAACCHQTLYMQYVSDTYDPVEWSKNALGLSEHYMLTDDVERAERCLKAAQQVASMAPHPAQDASEDELFGHPTLKIKADIHRAWGKLLSATLEIAAEEFVERTQQQGVVAGVAEVQEHLDCDAANKEEKGGEGDEGEEEKEEKEKEGELHGGLIFLKGQYAWKGRTCPEIKDIQTFEQARILFLRCRAEFSKALEFYILDGHVTDHITIQQEISKLFHHIAAFEKEVKRIAAMEKRRIQLLQPIANDINNEHYVLKTKELWYECAQAAQEIHEAYYMNVEAAFQTGGFPLPKEMKKSDEGIFMAVTFYEKFLHTMYSNEGKHKDIIDKDNLPSVLSAHFAMARLYGHGFGGATGNTTMRVEMLKKALEKHRWLVEFAERNIPDALVEMEQAAYVEGQDHKKIKEDGLFELELKVCKEMIELLPQRIDQIHRGLA